MMPRTVPVNWDDLEMALTTNPVEWTCYLDVRNGEVQMLPGGRHGEDDDWPSEEEIDAGLEGGHLVPIEPLGSSIEYGWMAEFTSTVPCALRDLLEALAGPSAISRFQSRRRLDYPAREAVLAFRSVRAEGVAGSRWALPST